MPASTLVTRRSAVPGCSWRCSPMSHSPSGSSLPRMSFAGSRPMCSAGRRRECFRDRPNPTSCPAARPPATRLQATRPRGPMASRAGQPRRQTSTNTRSTSPAARRRAKSIRCSAARLKCGRSSISSPAGGRTTRFSPARPALAKRQSWKDSPSGSPTAMCLSR